MSKIIDLDALVGPPKKVRLDGTVYELPADLPVSLYLKVSNFAESELTDQELYTELYDDLLELFRVHQPKLDALPSIGLATLVRVIPTVYGGGDAEDEGGARPSKAGTRNTKRKRKTTSRSSS